MVKFNSNLMEWNNKLPAFKRDCALYRADNGEVMLICLLELMISLCVKIKILRPNRTKKIIIIKKNE